MCSDHFFAGFDGHKVLNKDPIIWIDGARLPPKYICKYKFFGEIGFFFLSLKRQTEVKQFPE